VKDAPMPSSSPATGSNAIGSMKERPIRWRMLKNDDFILFP